MADDKRAPVQHTPKHLEGDGVFDEKHPAASAFAPAQPGAGVVADDVEEKGQNLTGAPTASEASKTFADQKEVLAAQHIESLQAGVAAPTAKASAAPAKPVPSAKAADSK